jgi:hypothetical protein
MIHISINLETGQARPAQALVLKAGGAVPVLLAFARTPGTSVALELALSPQSSSPAVVAYLDTFDRQNDTTFTGTLDASDSRLLALLEGKNDGVTLNAEVVVTTPAGRTYLPNVAVTCQPPIISGTPTVAAAGSSFRMASPDGSLWQISIADDGAITRTKL